jgi:predicted dehydrogenase
VGAGVWIGRRDASGAEIIPGAKIIPPSQRLNVAFVGVAHRASENLKELAKLANVNVVALCDVDDNYLADAAKKYPRARTYNDFRRMLDEGKDIDAVCVATPDHIHAIASISAMQAGKHVYCEKPLTRTVHECRTVTETAARLKRVTQMGTQIHAENNYRRVVELVQSGAVGPIREVHVFCSSQWAATQPVAAEEPVPPNLHYDLWVGPAKFKPYNSAFLPEKWRRYWNFGSGTLGDMGCHYIDLAFWSLGLTHPTRVSAKGPPPHPENCPTWTTIHWDFPARAEQPPVMLTWYDGGKRPPQSTEWGLNPKWGSGVVFVGEKGILFGDYNQHHLLPEKRFADLERPKPTIPESIGHHKEWVEACLRNDPDAPTCRFAYSGPLAEAVLLGTVAYRVGKPLEWDAKNLRATNAPEAEELIRQPYRQGWSI